MDLFCIGNSCQLCFGGEEQKRREEKRVGGKWEKDNGNQKK